MSRGKSQAATTEVRPVPRDCDSCAVADVARTVGWVCPLCAGLVQDGQGKVWVYPRPLFPNANGWSAVKSEELDPAPWLLLVE